MNTKKLLMAAGAAALIAGASGALAQEPPHGAPAERAAPKGTAAEHQNAKPAMPNAAQGGAGQNRSREDSHQNAAEQRGERGNVSEPQRRETTGQAPQNERQQRGQEENEGATDQGKGNRGQAGAADTRRNGNRNAGNTKRNQEQGARNNERGEVQRGEAQGVRGNERGEVQKGPGDARRETTGQGAAPSRTNITVNVSPEQRTRIHDVIVKEHAAPRVDHVDFNVSVGTRVPRSVHFVEVPREIVEIEPEWRGYDYFMVGDRFVIVDPATLDIVAVLVL